MLLGALTHSGLAAASAKPNIIFILADDLGYGDVRCLNPEGKIATPHMNRLAAEGMAFTDAHSSSSVCTPTRYGILTGRYNWRSRLKSGVLGGMSPALIEPGRLTVPAFLRQHGYRTACIGKWHLGLKWELQSGAPEFKDNIEKGSEGWNVDFSKPFREGPTSVGFDSFFGIAASLDMVPYTFLENDHVVTAPSTEKSFPMIVGTETRTTRKGPAAADFEADQVLPTLTAKSEEFIRGAAKDSLEGKPFFLYMPLNAPHTPIVPSKEWAGKSGISPYADFVMQTDNTVGRILDAVQQSHIAANTLIIVTSDNGFAPYAGLPELLDKGHNPNYKLRGTKADIFDGGHRIPMLVSWPGHVQAGSRSSQLTCLNDLFATCAEILGEKLPASAAEDSVSFLPALEGRATEPLREALVHHSVNGTFAIRQGHWKLELCPDSGGWSDPKPESPAAKGLPSVQLYDLSKDIGETQNLQDKHPEVVASLTTLLEKYVATGRSTPGEPQQNTGEVQIFREGKKAEGN
jgi:arylsulfatase A